MSDKTDHPPLPEAFAALGVRPSILRALADLKFTQPSEIQSLLIPRALAGVDLLGQARTGTGKTAAFAIPLLSKCHKGVSTQAIVLVPTRELAVQVDSEFQRLGQFTPIRTVAVYGGQKIAAQMKYLRHSPEIIIGTPGRVMDLLDRRIIRFDNIRFVVLDEVDRMLDIGFRDDIRKILSQIRSVRKRFDNSDRDNRRNEDSREQSQPHPADKAQVLDPHHRAQDTTDHAESHDEGHDEATAQPDSHFDAHDDGHSPRSENERHQTIFVSATISVEIEKLSRQYMQEPIEKLIAPGADDKPTVAEVQQFYFPVQPWDKYRLLRTLLMHEKPELAIVFCRTKRGAEKIAKRLHSDGIECREIHGNLAQNKRDRVMKSFRNGKFDVLVATDLASRGIDVADITHIINYDIPEDPEVYVHRVGRTARMGAAGKAYTFVSRDQGGELTKVESLINMVIPAATLEGFEASPTPADWLDEKPIFGSGEPAKPVVNRYERAYSPSGMSGGVAPAEGAEASEAPAPMTLPPRTIGSKIPINRRHKRRR